MEPGSVKLHQVIVLRQVAVMEVAVVLVLVQDFHRQVLEVPAVLEVLVVVQATVLVVIIIPASILAVIPGKSMNFYLF